ncbi:hypothetical protein AgCh_001976 [Apium graveolens]
MDKVLRFGTYHGYQAQKMGILQLKCQSTWNRVCNLFVEDRREWDDEVLRDICNERGIDLIKQVHISQRQREDSWMWLLDDKGEFTVRSCYRKLRGESECPDRNFWNKVWKLQLPGKAVEDDKHILFQCGFAVELWNSVGLSNLVMTDGASQVDVGCIARDDCGRFLRAKTAVLQGQFQPREAEAIGLREALSWIMPWRKTKCIFECDAKMVVDAVNGGSGNSYFHMIIDDCKDIIKHFDEVLVEAHSHSLTDLFVLRYECIPCGKYVTRDVRVFDGDLNQLYTIEFEGSETGASLIGVRNNSSELLFQRNKHPQILVCNVEDLKFKDFCSSSLRCISWMRPFVETLVLLNDGDSDYWTGDATAPC